MRRLLIVPLLLLVASLGHGAGGILLKDVFRTMPDSLMPYLTENNRLDFIDFLDSGMKAEVKNSLGGNSQMTALTADSLSIRMSDALRVDMLLLAPETPVGGDSIVCLVETFGTDSLSLQSVVSYFTTQWQRLSAQPPLRAADKRRIDALKLQTILKWDDEVLKKN